MRDHTLRDSCEMQHLCECAWTEADTLEAVEKQ